MTATGALVQYVPEGPERDELLGLLRIGMAFRAQQRGRRPGFLTGYVRALVAAQTENPRTFARLLLDLELAALTRSLRGPEASPIESVSRAMEVVTYHDPHRGRRQVAFQTLRNIAKLRFPG